MMTTRLLGSGFDDRPGPRRPIWLAHGVAGDDVVAVTGFDQADSLESFGELLAAPGAWLGVFDFPLGLARELVVARRWPQRWEQMVGAVARLGRGRLEQDLRDFRAGRPRRSRFALRATERIAGARPAMGTVGGRHALRFQAGAPLLLAAGVKIPRLHRSTARRSALEGNPALVATPITRGAWRSGNRRGRADVRELERERLVAALERGHPLLGTRLRIGAADRAAAISDDRGGRLAALLCLAQADWARRQPNWGMPADVDALEGWIVGADLPLSPATP